MAQFCPGGLQRLFQRGSVPWAPKLLVGGGKLEPTPISSWRRAPNPLSMQAGSITEKDNKCAENAAECTGSIHDYQ